MPSKQSSGRGERSSSRRRASLPRPGDPLVKANGSIVMPDPKESGNNPRPMDVKAKDFRALRRQNMDELPADTRLMNACAAVFAYTMLGISDREIQIALGLTEEKLNMCREHEAYTTLYAACSEELINVNSASLQARIAGMAHGALDEVFTISKTGKKDETRLTANRDILDRAGTRVADQAERSKGMPTGLRIVVTDDDAGKTVEASVSIGV